MGRTAGARRNTSTSWKFGLTASSLALAAGLPGAAFAQEAAQDEQPAPEEEIVVTGLRASLESSINTKRDNASIVEAVSAEDIGKLPDVSIAESIARLPGLAAQRVNGRAQVISIRGLAPDFTTTLLNGRQQASSGDNRAVEFDQYPSELLSSVVVYKTPDASIAGMGLSGSADLRTVRPLAFGKRVIALNLRGELDADGGKNADISRRGWRGTVSYIDQNASGTLGWSIGYAHLDSPSHVQHYKAFGYESFGGVCEPGTSQPPSCSPDTVQPDSADAALQLNGQEIWQTSRRNQRDGVMGALEWQPSDGVHSVLDLYYSRFKQKEVVRGAQWFSNGWADNATFTNVGLTEIGGSQVGTSGRVTNAVPILRNDLNTREDELFAAGLNNEFQLDDRTRFVADLSYSRNKRDETYIETYAGYGAGPFQTRTLDAYDFSFPVDGSYPTYDFGLDYADAAQISLGDRAPWGGWGHDGLLKSPHVKEDLAAIDLQLSRELDGFFSGIEIGVNYTRRVKSKTVDEFDLNLKNSRQQVLIGSQYLLDPTSLDFAGFGNVIAWDLAAALDNYYDQTPLEDANHFDKTWKINEDIVTWKAKANIDWGRLRGNVGVQVVSQFQASSGLRINQTLTPIALSQVYETAYYTDVLPSANLIYDLGGGHRFRLAAAKVLARPRMDDMRANFTPGFNTNPCGGSPPCAPGSTVNPWSATGGNPDLQPWRAKALDVAYEWYIGKATYISVAGFYKWLDNYIYNRNFAIDFSGLPIPTNQIPPGIVISPLGQVTMPANGPGGNLKGIEVSGAFEIGRLVPALDGFGFTGSYSYTESNLNPTDNNDVVRIPGLSGTVYNVTGYFEKWGFQARASYRFRSAFKGETVQLFTNRGYTEILADKQLDTQIGYTFPEGSALSGLGILLQVSNVTDSPYRTRLGLDNGGTQTSDGTPLPETYEKYGRQFLLGLNYRF
ncbi:TonB-dependent receptor [Sphingomonas sp. HF-S4]|uniref:TonB-dependent receptor n=1 Tax=Sphingomonas agrestis TaxID=3080540 RepID=A0ABU3Y443_9SPHN|nr:TonB-dependent receptor [Sphingomonas sp. HF-S4]MDV3456168.1 TonB-dependent receptor [Sphingomonas sp. HF-S4]